MFIIIAVLNAVDIIFEKLEVPWSIVHLSKDELLVTERIGTLNVINLNLNKRLEFKIENVVHIGEGGLLGAEKHPEFEKNGYIYLYYTTRKANKLINRVERFILKNGTLKSEKVILDEIPAGYIHNGGRIKFGPDRLLYITTGDTGIKENSQDIKSLAGKILRIKDDGSIPLDNPFGNEVYAYGIRNSQGIAWDDEGMLWCIDHGRSGAKTGLDELNLVKKGANYGWPIIEGDKSKPNMEKPVIHSGPKITWAPADLVYYKGCLYFTGLRGKSLYEYNIKAKKLSVKLKNKYGRLRALCIIDGFLYIGTSNLDGRGFPKECDDKIIKLKL
ncbi:MAG: PQQ-dependent sugar dehydrogenase [bacterium]|nr:PQQ-dependent sugar dehydrogenase [bacterium]